MQSLGSLGQQDSFGTAYIRLIDTFAHFIDVGKEGDVAALLCGVPFLLSGGQMDLRYKVVTWIMDTQKKEPSLKDSP